MPSFVSQMEVEVNVAAVPSVTSATSPNICVRAGCTNPAVESKDWDKEYCSNECVATHCRCVRKRQLAHQLLIHHHVTTLFSAGVVVEGSDSLLAVEYE